MRLPPPSLLLLTAVLLGAGCDPPAEAAFAPLEAKANAGVEIRIDPELKTPGAYRCLGESVRWHDYDRHVDVLARVSRSDDRPLHVVVASDPAERVDVEGYRRCLGTLQGDVEVEPGTHSHAARIEREAVEPGATKEERIAAREARKRAALTVRQIPLLDGPLAEAIPSEAIAPFRSHATSCHAQGWEPSSPKYTEILLGFAIDEHGKAVGLRAVTTIGMNDGIHRCLHTDLPDELVVDPALAARAVEEHRQYTEVRIPLAFKYKGEGHVLREGEKAFTTFDFGD